MIQDVDANGVGASEGEQGRAGQRLERLTLQRIDAIRSDRGWRAQEYSLVHEVGAEKGGCQRWPGLDHEACNTALGQLPQDPGKFEPALGRCRSQDLGTALL